MQRADEFQAIKARLLELEEQAATLGVHQAQVATTAKIVDSVFSKKRPAQTGEAKSKKPKTSKPAEVITDNKPTSSAYSAKSSDEAGSAVVTEGQDLHACLTMMRKMSPTPKGLDDVTAAADARPDAQDLHACLTMMRKISPTPKGVFLIRLGTFSQWTKVGDPPKLVTGRVHRAAAVRRSPTFVVNWLYKELKESMAIANEGKEIDFVLKWGRTIDFVDRFTKHNADFGAILNTKPMPVKTIHIEVGEGARAEDRLKNYVGYRGWQLTASGPEKLKDGTTRIRNRVELVLVPANFVAALKTQYDKLLEDFGGEADELAMKVQTLEATIDRQQELHAALLGADKQRNELHVARAEHKAALLAVQLDSERRFAERDAEEIKRSAG
ncbi:hypothetical protein HDU89_006080 [Geranomyces variabilis]|nr:hypothetical protein HDU89_006080 [Geranomyces variabilis]